MVKRQKASSKSDYMTGTITILIGGDLLSAISLSYYIQKHYSNIIITKIVRIVDTMT